MATKPLRRSLVVAFASLLRFKTPALTMASSTARARLLASTQLLFLSMLPGTIITGTPEGPAASARKAAKAAAESELELPASAAAAREGSGSEMGAPAASARKVAKAVAE